MSNDFVSFEKKLQGRCRDSRKMGNNTYLKRMDGRFYGDKPNQKCIGLLYHRTYILSFYEDRCVVDCNGWRSVTTKQRLVAYWPSYARHHIYSHAGRWCWHEMRHGWGGKPVAVFVDGDAIMTNGELKLLNCEGRKSIEQIEEDQREAKREHRANLRATYKDYYEFKDKCYRMAARVRKLSPEKWTPEMIKWLRNAELKRRVITHFGWDKVQTALGGVSVAKYGDMELVRVSGFAIPSQPHFRATREHRLTKEQLYHDVVLLKVVCPSTGSSYCLRVPPEMTDCETARRWTLGDNGTELELLVET